MKILEKPNGRREECASLANIGYHMFEVNLEGEVYTYVIPGIEDGCKAERVGSNRWKIITCDVLGNPIELVIRTDVLVGCAWCNVDENYGRIVSMPILSTGVKNSSVYPTRIKFQPTIRRVTILDIASHVTVRSGILRR